MSTTQRQVVSITPKNWALGEYSEPQSLSVFGRRIGPKLKKLEGFFLEEEYGKSKINKSE